MLFEKFRSVQYKSRSIFRYVHVFQKYLVRIGEIRTADLEVVVCLVTNHPPVSSCSENFRCVTFTSVHFSFELLTKSIRLPRPCKSGALWRGSIHRRIEFILRRYLPKAKNRNAMCFILDTICHGLSFNFSCNRLKRVKV